MKAPQPTLTKWEVIFSLLAVMSSQQMSGVKIPHNLALITRMANQLTGEDHPVPSEAELFQIYLLTEQWLKKVKSHENSTDSPVHPKLSKRHR